MRTVTETVYTYAELSEKAKQAVKSSWEYDDFWYKNREISMKAARELYNILDPANYDNYILDISGVRLYKYIVNNILPKLKLRFKYVKGGGKYESHKAKSGERLSKIQYSYEPSNLTGLCYDYDFLKPIMDFLKKPDENTTNLDLFETDLGEINRKLAEEEYDNFYSEEEFASHMEANGYEFYQDGTRY